MLVTTGHMKVPTLLVFSMEDQYVPKSISKDYRRVGTRLSSFMSNAETVFIEGANHELKDPKHAQQFVKQVVQFLGVSVQ